MRFISSILVVFIISCNNHTETLDRDKKIHDSIVQSKVDYRKYCDSLYEIKRDKFITLKKQIPFSQDYYEWYEIASNQEILNDQSDRKYHSISLGEITEPDLIISDDCYGDRSGSYSIFDIINEKKGVLFMTVSRQQKDTVLWKIDFFSNDSATAVWSYKKINDKEFNSLGSFISQKRISQFAQ